MTAQESLSKKDSTSNVQKHFNKNEKTLREIRVLDFNRWSLDSVVQSDWRITTFDKTVLTNTTDCGYYTMSNVLWLKPFIKKII